MPGCFHPVTAPDGLCPKGDQHLGTVWGPGSSTYQAVSWPVSLMSHNLGCKC